MSSTKQELLVRLNAVFQDVFDDDDIEINEMTSSEDIPEWDSLMHVTLVVATEREFNVKLNAAEIGKLENVGSLLDLLVVRLKK